MIRRILVMVVACALFSGACMALAGRAKEGYPLMPAVDPMSREEVEACLRESGVHVERFAGEVPFAHVLRVEVEARRDGQPPQRLLDGATLAGAAGLHRLLLLGREEPGGLKLSAVYVGPGDKGGGAVQVEQPIPLGDLGAVRWERPPDRGLALGRRVEICRLSGGQQTVAVLVTLERR
jgi:hypothetical protein